MGVLINLPHIVNKFTPPNKPLYYYQFGKELNQSYPFEGYDEFNLGNKVSANHMLSKRSLFMID